MIGRSRAARNGKGPDGRSSSGSLPKEILAFAKVLQKLLPLHPAPKDWDRLQLTRVIDLKYRPFLMRGSVLPSHPPTRKGYVFLLLEPITLRRDSLSDSHLHIGHFTPRERSILRLLARGHSNHAIAGTLGLSIHTVKDRLKLLMFKTQTTTRIGLVAHLLKTQAIR